MQQTQDETLSQGGEISLRDYLELLRRRKRIFVQTFVVVLTLGAAITFATKPLYRAETRILVEGRAMAMAQYVTNDPLSNLFMPDVGHDIETQTEVLQGDKVLGDAYRAADVPGDAAKVDVNEVKATDVIAIGVNSTNKIYAERLVKALPTTYINYITGNTQNEVTNALTFAQNRLREENDKLQRAETSLQKFKTQKKVASVDVERSQQISIAASADAELKKSQSDVDSARARLATLEAAKRAEPDVIDTSSSASNTGIDAIKNSIAILNVERVRLLILHKENSVEVQQVDAQIKTLQDRLASLPAMVTTQSSTRNPEKGAYDAKIADARASLASVEATMASIHGHAVKAKAELARYSPLERTLNDLQREIEIRQVTVAQLTKSVNDLSLRSKAGHNPIHVISNTEQAQLIAPMKGRNMLYAGAIGLVLALCFALLQEFLDDRIHTPEDARKLLGVPVLGYIPMVDNEQQRMLIKAKSNGSLLESYRVLRSNVQFATVDSSANSLMVTSSVPAEGKSTTAANLAVAMALDGKKVILVDADLRRPSLHTKLEMQNNIGMTNVMLGQFSLDEALQQTAIPNLRLLTAGSLPPNPAELLHSQTMSQLHEMLKERSDMVIFDSPPCLATADSQVLSAQVDGVVYIVQAGEARKSGVRHAGEMLNQAHARLLGIVMNKLEVSSGHDSYYGYYGYYQAAAIEDGKARRNGGDTQEMLLPKAAPEGMRTVDNPRNQESEAEDNPIVNNPIEEGH